MEELVDQYEQILRRQIEDLTIQDFIPIILRIVPRLSFRDTSLLTSAQTITYLDFPNLPFDTPTMVLGPAGAGKTTLVVRTIEERLSNDGSRRVPVYVPMSLFDGSMALPDYVRALTETNEYAWNSVEQGNALIIWDGVNEALSEDIDNIFQEIIEFQDEHKNNSFIATCRTSVFPMWCREVFSLMHVMPLDRDEILAHLESHLNEDTWARAQEVFIRPDVSSHIEPLLIFDNPLVLSMFLVVVSTPVGGELAIEDLTNRSAIYDAFVGFARDRDLEKRRRLSTEKSIHDSTYDVFLGAIAAKMVDTDKLSLRRTDIETFLLATARNSERVAQAVRDDESLALLAISTVLSNLPIKSSSLGSTLGKAISFFHQTFCEYYCAREIHASADQTQKAERILALMSDAAAKYWDVVRFLYDMSNSDQRAQIKEVLLANALRDKRQEWLALIVDLFECEADVEESEQTDLKIRILEAFKNWGKPFDYGLIHALKRLNDFCEQTSNWRLERDVARFVAKYAESPPVHLRYAHLLELMNLVSEGGDRAVDAAYSIGKTAQSSDDKSEAVRFIFDQYSKSNDLVKEQLIGSMREIESRASFSFLEDVSRSKSEPTMARVFALNALSVIGGEAAEDAILEYITDRSNRYRDSACWSLQMVARKTENVEKQRKYKQTFWDLANEPSEGNPESTYLRGNAIYSLGVIGAKEFSEPIVSLAETESDAYVVEDALFCLHLLNHPLPENLISMLVDSNDPALRFKLAELLSLNLPGHAALAKLRKDSVLVVRQAARLSTP